MTGPRGLVALGFLNKKTARLPRRPADPAARAAYRFLQGYFSGRPTRPRIPVDWTGLSPFSRRVYEALSNIRFGRTVTYGDLARKIRKPGASRAVGNAMRQNPILIYLPCHRVVRSDGRPAGFAAGVTVKKWLLSHESKGHRA